MVAILVGPYWKQAVINFPIPIPMPITNTLCHHF